MEDYFEKYKYAKLVLLGTFEELEREKKRDNKGFRYNGKLDEFNIDIKNPEYKEYIYNILNINNDVISKNQMLKLLKKVRDENKKEDIDYKQEYMKILLAFIYIIEENYKVNMSKDDLNFINNSKGTHFDLIKNNINMIKFTDKDIDKEGNYVFYSNMFDLDSPLDKLWNILNFDKNDILQEQLNMKKEEILNNLNKFSIKK